MMRVSVDVGGTFTDVVGIDDESSRIVALKVQSTPSAPEVAFVDAVKRLITENQIRPTRIENIVHAGTIGSNLFLGQLGINMPNVALVTTSGFRDVLEIGRQNRPELYNVFFQRPKPLIPRKLRFEVKERTDANGTMLLEVDRAELDLVAENLRNGEVDSVAICFLNSYLNPSNERKTKDALAGSAKFVFSSFEVDPEHREYERTSTTVVNAVLAPVVSLYLNSTLAKLEQAGVTAPLLLLSSSGGMVDVEIAMRKPVVAIESGPAAGVMGAAAVAKKLERRNVLSLDMGGTTAKAGCIVDYTPLIVPELEVGGRVHLGRAIKGSGYPVRYPSLDMAEVSAGGGTIVWADEIGTLRVGPLSAGATPGPACYGSGGQAPTVTDANLILGRLGTALLGREMTLNPKLAREAMRRVANETRMSVVEAASASIRLVNLHMARALDIVSLERGQDPRKFTLMAFGGAGPMHAAELAGEIGVDTVVIPPYPGLFSSLGMIMTDMKYAYVKGVLKLLDDLPNEFFAEAWETMTHEAISNFRPTSNSPAPKTTISRSVDARYLGQGFELEVEIPAEFNRLELQESFERKHEAVYGYRHGGPIEITALRLILTIATAKPSLTLIYGSNRKTEQRARRNVWFNDAWFYTRIIPRSQLASGPIEGPTIIEEYDSTIVVPPGWVCNTDEYNCVIMERKS